MVEVRNTPVVLAAFTLALLVVVVAALLLQLFGGIASAAAKLGIVGVDAPLVNAVNVLVPASIIAAVVIILAAAYATIEEE